MNKKNEKTEKNSDKKEVKKVEAKKASTFIKKKKVKIKIIFFIIPQR